MPEEGFEVHGPHDHELHHAAVHGRTDSFVGRIAVTTAILATVGALFSYEGGATQANASLYKNNAAIKKTEAANQWSYYQAKSTKQNLAEVALLLVPPDKHEQFKDAIKRYSDEKTAIKTEAEKIEAESAAWDERSDHELHVHHRWAQATTFLQISIALSAIALLTRKKWLQWAVYGIALLGVCWGIAALGLV
jgi:hypothetical protein